MEITQEQLAEKLLWPLWRCLDEEYKVKYKRDVWEHFENAIKSSSYTSKLTVFLSKFKDKLPVYIEIKYGEDIQKIIESGLDYEILNWLRNDTTYLCLIVRLKNQDRKEMLKFNNE